MIVRDKVICFSLNGVVSAFALSTGQLLWRTELGGYIVARPPTDGQMQIFSVVKLLEAADQAQKFHYLLRSINLEDGSIAESFEFKAHEIDRIIAYNNRKIYFSTQDTLSFFDLKAATQLSDNNHSTADAMKFGTGKSVLLANIVQDSKQLNPYIYIATATNLLQLEFDNDQVKTTNYQRYRTHPSSETGLFLYSQSSNIKRYGRNKFFLNLSLASANKSPVGILLQLKSILPPNEVRIKTFLSDQTKCLAATDNFVLSVAGDDSVTLLTSELKNKWRKLSSDTLGGICYLDETLAIVGTARDSLLVFSVRNGKLINRIAVTDAVKQYYATHRDGSATDQSSEFSAFDLRGIIRAPEQKFLLLGDRQIALYAP